jgi:hypothetical protein
VSLCGIAALNVSAWVIAARALRRNDHLSGEDRRFRQAQLILSAGYVLGCAFRSIVPVYDVPRLALHDTWISSAFVGRSVATVAELCFAGQWALILHELGRATRSRFVSSLPVLVMFLIGVAEACSWYSVLTTTNFGHVIEQSLWGACAVLIVTAVALVLAYHAELRRPALIAWCAAGTAYVTYMFLVDVPRYWRRWVADQAAHHVYLGLADGVSDAFHRRIVSYRWEDWQGEVVWMTLYFSVAVWISISLIFAPSRRQLSSEAISPAMTIA